MDPFTEQLFELAYRSCRSLKRRRGGISVRELTGRVESHWVTYRDGTIACWAARIRYRVPRRRLAALAGRLVDLVDAEEIYGWEPPVPEDADACATFSAFALATLRWINRERAGRVPAPDYTPAEAAAWLAGRYKAVQLSLWDEMT